MTLLVVVWWQYLRWSNFGGRSTLSKILVNMCWLIVDLDPSVGQNYPKNDEKGNCWLSGWGFLPVGVLDIREWVQSELMGCVSTPKKYYTYICHSLENILTRILLIIEFFGYFWCFLVIFDVFRSFFAFFRSFFTFSGILKTF